MKLRFMTFVAVLAMALSVHTASAQIGESMWWTIDGQSRRAIVYAPVRESANGRSPVVLSFHGSGDNVENYQFIRLQRYFPEAVILYLQGLPRGGSGNPGWQAEQGADEDRDLKLVDAALASLRERFKVDDDRIYATGYSNGGHFTYLLWAVRPDVFAAFAPVAARLRPTVQPRQPKPLFHTGGMRDPSVAFADQKQAFEVARRVNHATGEGSSCGPSCTLYASPGGTPVMTWIHNGGHEYPEGTSDRIANFFREHSLSSPEKQPPPRP